MKYIATRSYGRWYTKDEIYDLVKNEERGPDNYLINHYDSDNEGFWNTLNDYHSMYFKKLEPRMPLQIKLL